MAQDEEMNQTPNAQRPTLNVELTGGRTIEHQTQNIQKNISFFWRIVDFAVAGIFIYAGALKAIDPVELAHDIDNYKMLPWPISVALAFYLPWLEIFCALGLVFRFLYRGALSILSASIVVFTLAHPSQQKFADSTSPADVSVTPAKTGVSRAHLITNLAILAGLLALSFKATSGNRLQNAV